MKESIEFILNNYVAAYHKKFPRLEVARILERELPLKIAKDANITSQYEVRGSVGIGRWSFVPWIGIFDVDITRSAQTGYYIVYLFDEKMKGVYLSLNQGYIQYEKSFGRKKVRIEMRSKATEFRDRIYSSLSDFS